MIVSDLRQDLGYAARNLVRSPGFAAVAVLIVGLGVGAPTLVSVKQAIALAVERKCHVISCSFVLPAIDDALRDLVRDAHAVGRVVVAAAGNKPEDRAAFPEDVPHAIVVSALDSDDVPLRTRRTRWTDVYAFGGDLDVVDGDGLKRTWPGQTSRAAAIVSGIVALALATVPAQERSALGMAIEGLLKSTATRVRGDASILRINAKRLLATVKHQA